MTPNPSDAEKKARRDAVERIRLLCELYVFYSTLLLPSTYVVGTWVRCLFWVACVSIYLSIYLSIMSRQIPIQIITNSCSPHLSLYRSVPRVLFD